MPKIDDQCCDAEQLQELLNEQLGEQNEAELLLHIDGCAKCQRALEMVAADKRIWDELPAHLSSQVGLGRRATDGIRDPEQGHAELGAEQFAEYLGPTDHPNMLGRLGNYEVCGVVGRGSTGIVVKAFEATLNRYVAIKVLSPSLSSSGAARRRFEREGRAIAAVAHEHVVPIYAVDEYKGLPYIVMQYVAGASLQRRIDQHGPLSTREIVRIAMQVSRGLAAAHAQGIVHRDIKPANILLEHGLDRAMVTDFGLAMVIDSASVTMSSVIAGTPSFMAPEQARGESIDDRSDLFSLGSVIYAMCTANSPFRSETVYGVLRRICEDEARPIREVNPEMPEWLEALVAKLHSKAKEDRFESAQQLSEILTRELAHLQSPTSIRAPERPWFTARAARQNRRGLMTKIAVIGVISAALGALLYPFALGVAAKKSGDESESNHVAQIGPQFLAAIDGEQVDSDSPAQVKIDTRVQVDSADKAGGTAERTAGALNRFENVKESKFPVKSGGRLTLIADVGNVEVSTSDEEQIVVRTTVSAASQEDADKLAAQQILEFKPEEADLAVTAKIDKGDGAWDENGARQFRRIDFRISVPRKYSVNLTTVSGNLSTDNLNGEARLQSVSGNLRVVKTQGAVFGKTSGGNIDLADCERDAELYTAGGNVAVRNTTGFVVAKTAGGNMLVENAIGGIEARTAGGNIKAAIPNEPKKDWKMSAIAGEIEVHLDKQLALNIDASTQVGHIATPLPSSAEGANNRQSTRARLNGGGPTISAQTTAGNISFEYLK